ncbi:MAG: carboxypeptidase-like regulatory domain-containing protein [Candidatus Marinimicrobia bacterium]|jgi:hypothetical protein|nr:carboxypeptidase-like regulatory domain-containing protein [Candidatus Neomarinimicrobiota bacterium]MBT3681661.1 carboxypeptidase-like regulatory domain-containing protein [Candidatus Neomarinimicrobiota bacterium]MBT3894975.1 carboxypeptidase-like regulatory domain-containing protein [Candidatus Neomarinimicrobiota bacterium]MBT4171752.1 carboxypeptidase-like regulatory domain-containing protein [Candidatus Neomarinimicrobiota bacterium]MBT4850666.1 carboxypeptidase-like regulatory domain-
MMKSSTFIILFLFNVTCLTGQTISGYIRDSETGRALPYSNISLQGTNRGTTSNLEGYYQFRLIPGKYQLSFQYLGYHSETVDIQLIDQNIKLNIELSPQVLPIDGITVYAEQKSTIELLILKASRQKRKSMEYLHNYSCNSYTKTSYRSSQYNINAYGGIFETYSELYFNAPERWRQIIMSQKQTSNIPNSINLISGNTFLDINSDRIHIGNKNLIGPTAPDAINHYKYIMADTLFQDNYRIFKINFTPLNNDIPSMRGSIYLADKIFLIKQIDVQLNAECNYDVFEDIHIIQKYKVFKDSLFLPIYSFRESKFVIDIPKYPVLIIKKENFRENYLIDNDDNFIHPDQDAVVFKNSLDFDAVTMHIPPLNKDELKAYEAIDSLVQNNKKISAMVNMLKLMDKYAWIRTLPIGNFSDFFRFNRVEGSFLGISIDTKNQFNPLSLGFGYGYGFGDKKTKYIFSPELSLSRKHSVSTLALDFYDRIETRENQEKYPINLNTYSSIFNDFDFFDYYYAKGFSINTDFSISQFTLSAKYLNEWHSSAIKNIEHGIFNKNNYFDNPVISEGHNIGINLNFIYSNILYQDSGFGKREIPNQTYWETEFSIQTGIPEFGGDFNFSKYHLALYLKQNISHSGFLDMSFFYGFSKGILPGQYLFELNSGFAGFRRYKSFATLDQNAFYGKKKIALYLEYNVYNSIFKTLHLPASWEFSMIYNTGWAGNNDLNHINYTDIYSEYGFGLNKIFKLIKFEFIWSEVDISNSKSFCFIVKIDDFDIF